MCNIFIYSVITRCTVVSSLAIIKYTQLLSKLPVTKDIF